MRLRMMVLAVLMAGVLLVPASASAQAPSATITDPVPITATGPAGTFVGQFNFDRFARRSGQLVALGTVTGTFTPTGSRKAAQSST